MKDNYFGVLVVLLTGLMASSWAMAQDYYKWVDELGVTHYSEVRPADNVEHETLILPGRYNQSANPEDDYYSIQNQLDRTLARSEQIARLRPARKTEPPQLSRVEVIDNRGGFFIPNNAQNYSSHTNDRRFNGRPLQTRGGTRIGNQLRRQGIIPNNRQPLVRSASHGKGQSGYKRPSYGLTSR